MARNMTQEHDTSVNNEFISNVDKLIAESNRVVLTDMPRFEKLALLTMLVPKLIEAARTLQAHVRDSVPRRLTESEMRQLSMPAPNPVPPPPTCAGDSHWWVWERTAHQEEYQICKMCRKVR